MPAVRRRTCRRHDHRSTRATSAGGSGSRVCTGLAVRGKCRRADVAVAGRRSFAESCAGERRIARDAHRARRRHDVFRERRRSRGSDHVVSGRSRRHRHGADGESGRPGVPLRRAQGAARGDVRFGQAAGCARPDRCGRRRRQRGHVDHACVLFSVRRSAASSGRDAEPRAAAPAHVYAQAQAHAGAGPARGLGRKRRPLCVRANPEPRQPAAQHRRGRDPQLPRHRLRLRPLHRAPGDGGSPGASSPSLP